LIFESTSNDGSSWKIERRSPRHSRKTPLFAMADVILEACSLSDPKQFDESIGSLTAQTQCYRDYLEVISSHGTRCEASIDGKETDQSKLVIFKDPHISLL
jgi:hypothetical protein